MQSCTQWVHAPLPLQNPPRAYPVTLASWLRTDYGRVVKALVEAGTPLKGVRYPTDHAAVEKVLRPYFQVAAEHAWNKCVRKCRPKGRAGRYCFAARRIHTHAELIVDNPAACK